VFGVGVKAAHEEGGYEGFGCLYHDMVMEVLFGVGWARAEVMGLVGSVGVDVGCGRGKGGKERTFP
jgi:hypothetical protein